MERGYAAPVRLRKPRLARNPRTGEPCMVSERKVVTFKPGKIMEEKCAGRKTMKPTEKPSLP